MRISTGHSPASRVRGGFTLVEFMMAVLLSGIIMTGILTTNLSLMRSGVRVTHYAEMSAQVRRGVEQFAGDVRNAVTVTWNGTSDVTLTLPSLAGTTSQVTYAWTAASQSFFRVPGASSAATAGRVYLITGIPLRPDGSAGCIFSRYDRDGNAASTDATTKKLQVSMNLVRTARTAATSTDMTVSPIFNLRNKP